MTEQGRKKPKPYFDYRKRVLALRSKKRQRSEGNPAMSTPTQPPATIPSVTESAQLAPEPVQAPASQVQSPAAAQDTQAVAAESPAVAIRVSEAVGAAEPTKGEATDQSPAAAQDQQVAPADSPSVAAQVSEAEDAASATKSEATGKKAKAEPETLEQFIEYAYGRKGQRLVLKPKVERQIAQSPRLDDAALIRLLQLAKGDTLLSVPRQLLLLSQEVTGLPGLRAAITAFVSDAMLRHPVFSAADVQGTLRNLPGGLPVADALAKVAAFTPVPEVDMEPLKGADLQELRHNAVQLFVTWLAVNRGLNSEALSSLLFQVIWQPAAKDLPDDSARLRALTDIGQAAGVGLACERFRQQAIDARVQQDQSQREAASLRESLAAAEAQLTATAARLEARQAELLAMQESSAAELEALRRQHAVDKTHLQHELEQLRGRLVKRLTDGVDMLEVGLSALRKDTPRVPVMVERAEHVVDALRAEIRELREE